MGKIVTKEVLSPVEEAIYQNLKQLKTKDSPLNIKIQELKAMYLKWAEEEKKDELIQFNDTNRFNTKNFNSDLFKSYIGLKRRNIDNTNKAAIINDMYHKIQEIVDELQGNTIHTKYAIYFHAQGKTYRSFVEDIPVKFLKLNNSKSSTSHEMQIYAAKFKDYAKKIYSNGQMKNTSDITSHYNTFKKTLQDTYMGKSKIPNKIINEGIIAEAFERHLQQMHQELIYSNGKTLNDNIGAKYDWTVDEAWRLVRASTGNDPWYTGGDVKDIQVKSLASGDRKVTGYKTIEDMFNYLTYLERTSIDDVTLREQAREAFNLFYNKVGDELDSAAKLTAEEIIKDFIMKENKI